MAPNQVFLACLNVMFADGLTAEEAEALLGADGGGLPPESSDSFLGAISPFFYDVYSDAYYEETLVPHEPRWLPTGCPGNS
jgi:hypothetical protein